jgi:hypothetical protein
MGRVKPSEERRAEFFGQVDRCIRLALLVPKAKDLDPADTAQIAEAEIILRELDKARAELDRLIERERNLSRQPH